MTGRTRSAADWLFADRATGRWVIGQTPNAAIVVFVVTVLVRLVVPDDAPLAGAVALVGRGALIVWGLDELARGVNPFRRGLGLGVLVWQVAALVR